MKNSAIQATGKSTVFHSFQERVYEFK